MWRISLKILVLATSPLWALISSSVDWKGYIELITKDLSFWELLYPEKENVYKTLKDPLENFLLW